MKIPIEKIEDLNRRFGRLVYSGHKNNEKNKIYKKLRTYVKKKYRVQDADKENEDQQEVRSSKRIRR